LEGAGVSDLDTAYNVIVVARPFSGWSQFNESIDDSSLSSTDKNIIKTNCNPNRFKPSPFTTEFCFNSGGFYEIHAKGILYNTDNQSAITAEKEVTAVVHVYDIWSKTTKEDFTAGDTDFDGIDDTGEGAPEYEKVNWLNSCPVNSNDDDLLYGDSANYETIPGSIKLGFWDNFDEENFGTATGGYGWSWEHWQETIYEDIKISDKDNDGDNELTTASHDFSSFELMGISSGQWNAGQRFMVRAHYGNHSVSTWEGWEDTGALEFQGPGDTHKLFLNEFRCIYWGGQVDLNYDGNTEEVEDFMDSMLRANWYGGGGDHYMFINDLYESDAGGLYSGSGSQEYPPDGNRINPSSVSYKLVVDDRSNPNYTPYLAVNSIGTAHHVWGDPKGSMSKTYTADNTNFHARPDLGDNDRYDFMWHDSGNSFLKNDWRLKLYANSRIPEWDEVRIIYPEGFYTSPTFTLPAHSQLGAISWTETIPESADPSSEKISLKINRGSGFVTPSSNGAVFGQSGDLTGAASTLQFKVTLSSDDVFHEQTPVFEDLSLTYLLPKTEILYWSKK
jgi:hypothetical protein